MHVMIQPAVNAHGAHTPMCVAPLEPGQPFHDFQPAGADGLTRLCTRCGARADLRDGDAPPFVPRSAEGLRPRPVR